MLKKSSNKTTYRIIYSRHRNNDDNNYNTNTLAIVESDTRKRSIPFACLCVYRVWYYLFHSFAFGSPALVTGKVFFFVEPSLSLSTAYYYHRMFAAYGYYIILRYFFTVLIVSLNNNWCALELANRMVFSVRSLHFQPKCVPHTSACVTVCARVVFCV